MNYKLLVCLLCLLCKILFLKTTDPKNYFFLQTDRPYFFIVSPVDQKINLASPKDICEPRYDQYQIHLKEKFQSSHNRQKNN